MNPAILIKKFSTLIVFFVTLTTCGLAQGNNPAAEKPGPKLTYLLVGRLFDATSDNIRENMIIAVEDERIKSVTSAADLKIPPGANVIDLSQATVLPGLIDCHTHLDSRADRYNEIYRFKDTPFDSAFAGVINARKTLEAGFTSVRDVGSKPFLAVDLRNSINEGYLVGPRIVASGPAISITGGHGDLNNYSPQTQVMMFPRRTRFPDRRWRGSDSPRHSRTGEVRRGRDQDHIHRRRALARRQSGRAAIHIGGTQGRSGNRTYGGP